MSTAVDTGGACPHAPDTSMPPYLASLSRAQYKAVTAPPNVPLQILAGPGSGKTRVLVARVTWLILANRVRPNDLVVVTFTNKAANEMRQRLNKLIGPERTANLILGTFHATCARYLRRNAKAVDLQNNFSICDADEAKKALKAILKEQKSRLEAMGLPSNLKVEQVMSEISRAKAKDMGPEAYVAHLNRISAGGGAAQGGRRVESTEVRRAAAEVYTHYQTHLKRNNAVDFDDLLVYGVRLFRDSPDVIGNVQHVLVDEFQDTNAIQYALMSELAGPNGSRHSVSVVGDPDQSIYGWRSAEVGNLALMKHDFGGKRIKDGEKSEGVEQVFLEENYRSTGHILNAAKSIIEGDSDRIDRGLYTSHPVGSKVVLKRHASSQHEASFVATEVKRLVAHSGGLFSYDDFAILLRYNALSREVERQLQSENVPSRMMGGARFFERKEVKDILAYLTLADNPVFTPALERVVNVPKRGIGEKALKDLMELAEQQQVRTMEIIERAVKAPNPILGIRPGTIKSLKGFVEVVQEIRRMALAHTPVATIIEKLLARVDYEGYLKKEDDYAQRWENVKELINFSTIVGQAGTAMPYEPPESDESDQEVDGDGMNYEEEGGNVSWGSFSTTANGSSSSATGVDLERGVSNSTSDSKVKRELVLEENGRGKRKVAEVIDLASSDEEDVKPARKKATENKSLMQETRKTVAKATSEGFEGGENASLMSVEDEQGEGLQGKSPLRVFLEASTLSTDMEQDDSDGKSPKVTIATTHAAKGLEFPVVFILAVENGTFPFFRCTTSEEINEECRLLYVAATRAQTHLYFNYCSTRMSHGETREQSLSPFVARIADAKAFKGGLWKSSSDASRAAVAGGFMGPAGAGVASSTATRPADKVDFASSRQTITKEDRSVIARVLDRKPVEESAAADLVSRFDNSDAGARSAAADSVTSAMDEMRGGSFFNMHRHEGSFAGPSQFTSARSLISPRLTPIGTPLTSTNGAKKYDKDGWAARTSVRPSARPTTLQGQGFSRPTVAPASSSSFMDQYRLSKNHLAHEAMTMNGLLGHPAPKTDVKSLQNKNNEALKGFMDMLPADAPPSASASQSSKPRQASASTTGTAPKKRLGMGRARKG